MIEDFVQTLVYGPEVRGFESLTACQKTREILGFHEFFLFSSAFVFPPQMEQPHSYQIRIHSAAEYRDRGLCLP